MRATYEDLLRAARRAAVEAHRIRHADQDVLVAGWQSVLAATRIHLRWLRDDVQLLEQQRVPEADSDTDLRRLARLVGAGADLLAAQDAHNAAALDNQSDLAAARAEVAAIAQIAGRVVLRDQRVAKRSPEYRRLLKTMTLLERIVIAGGSGPGLGTLRNLATDRPRFGTDEFSHLAWMAARWERAHQDVEPHTLLTRDLRSVTAQLRSLCGYGWHLADCVTSAARVAGLDAQLHLDLRRLKDALLAFDAGARRVSHSWQRRLSDIGGQSGTPGEIAFLDLETTFDRLLRSDSGLRPPTELIPNRRRALGAIDALDELVDAAARVARFQQYAVSSSIQAGTFFVPRRELARVLPRYLRLSDTGRRSPNAGWVRTNLPAFFAELVDSLAWSTDHLSIAAGLARNLAGTATQRRPLGDKTPRTMPPLLAAPRRVVAQGAGFPDQGQELVGPGR